MSARDLDAELRAAGQEHLIPLVARSDSLRAEVEDVDLALVADLVERFVRGDHVTEDLDIQPPQVICAPASEGDVGRDLAARQLGEAAIRANEVALVLVAGGQGTRLGFDGPKGDFPFAPVTGRTLFWHHAAKVAALRARYGPSTLPWYIMTSPENDAATRASFAAAGWYGLDPVSVRFLVQGTMPAVDRVTGRILLADADHLALSPDGHGGLLHALVRGGHVQEMRSEGIRTIFTFQVDNPLVRIARPEFVGYHRGANAEMSSVVVRKRHAAERMGVVARNGKQTLLVEYSDLPAALAEQCLPDGSLAFWAGSIAVHCIELDLVERIAANGGRLPFHRAVKAVPYLAEDGSMVRPSEANAVKFESFIFDGLPLAAATATVEARRGEEFSPIKNAEGDDSPESCRRDLTRLGADWLATVGVSVPRDADGVPVNPIEIDPHRALRAEDLVGLGDLDTSMPILIQP
jgi:UDP-N-acetylglucosamine/UDP-N-acetylgalactosamine diphosphorylase